MFFYLMFFFNSYAINEPFETSEPPKKFYEIFETMHVNEPSSVFKPFTEEGEIDEKLVKKFIKFLNKIINPSEDKIKSSISNNIIPCQLHSLIFDYTGFDFQEEKAKAIKNILNNYSSELNSIKKSIRNSQIAIFSIYVLLGLYYGSMILFVPSILAMTLAEGDLQKAGLGLFIFTLIYTVCFKIYKTFCIQTSIEEVLGDCKNELIRHRISIDMFKRYQSKSIFPFLLI